ncbi:hypothetical protein [Spirillospora sp. CA-294931]|uniref:hypothetical protein n=1 Tax=Spirillospora sp. CA-294931 TaxID=3240042 RepID=UPI003D92A7DD
MSDVPMPSQEMVDAARTHLTGKYAEGLEQLLWETDKYPLPDLEAVRAVLAVTGRPDTTGPDLAAALVLIQAARLTVDRLEADVMQAAREAGLSWEQVAAVLDLPDSVAAGRRYREMLVRRDQPNVEPPTHRLNPDRPDAP